MHSIELSLLKECLRPPVVEKEGELCAAFCFSSDFPGFAGHFPDQPVLPAVVQLAAVRFLAAEHLGRPLQPVSVSRTKFKAMIGPDDEMRVRARIQRTDETVTLSFTITANRDTAAVGELVCSFDNG